MSGDCPFTKVCDVSEVPSGYSTSVEVDGQRIAVFNYEGEFYATEDSCPHAGANLAGSRMYKGKKVACPVHGWIFSLEANEDKDGLKRFPAKVEDGRVMVSSQAFPADQPAPPPPPPEE